VVAVAVLAVVVVLVVAYLVGTLVQAIVSGQLSRLFQSEMRRRAVARRQFEVLAEAARIKRELDAQAFATHLQMLQIAQEHRKDQQ